jgi:hypothetical protein
MSVGGPVSARYRWLAKVHELPIPLAKAFDALAEAFVKETASRRILSPGR